MKQIARRLTDWWFSTLIPGRGPLTTIDAREHLAQETSPERHTTCQSGTINPGSFGRPK